MNALLINLYCQAENYFFRVISSKCLNQDDGDYRMQCFEHLPPVFLPNGPTERACQSDKTRAIL